MICNLFKAVVSSVEYCIMYARILRMHLWICTNTYVHLYIHMYTYSRRKYWARLARHKTLFRLSNGQISVLYIYIYIGLYICTPLMMHIWIYINTSVFTCIRILGEKVGLGWQQPWQNLDVPIAIFSVEMVYIYGLTCVYSIFYIDMSIFCILDGSIFCMLYSTNIFYIYILQINKI